MDTDSREAGTCAGEGERSMEEKGDMYTFHNKELKKKEIIIGAEERIFPDKKI